jgi:hypothetical protein
MSAGPFNVGAIDLKDLLGEGVPRYFYALRREDSGELHFGKIDQLIASDQITINNPGTVDGNYENFEVGVDFFEGRDANHNLVFENLNYEQYRWDGRLLYYYIDDAGELVVRINEVYNYPSGI